MFIECNKYRSIDFFRKQFWDGKLRDINIYQLFQGSGDENKDKEKK